MFFKETRSKVIRRWIFHSPALVMWCTWKASWPIKLKTWLKLKNFFMTLEPESPVADLPALVGCWSRNPCEVIFIVNSCFSIAWAGFLKLFLKTLQSSKWKSKSLRLVSWILTRKSSSFFKLGRLKFPIQQSFSDSFIEKYKNDHGPLHLMEGTECDPVIFNARLSNCPEDGHLLLPGECHVEVLDRVAILSAPHSGLPRGG